MNESADISMKNGINLGHEFNYAVRAAGQHATNPACFFAGVFAEMAAHMAATIGHEDSKKVMAVVLNHLSREGDKYASK